MFKHVFGIKKKKGLTFIWTQFCRRRIIVLTLNRVDDRCFLYICCKLHRCFATTCKTKLRKKKHLSEKDVIRLATTKLGHLSKSNHWQCALSAKMTRLSLLSSEHFLQITCFTLKEGRVSLHLWLVICSASLSLCMLSVVLW